MKIKNIFLFGAFLFLITLAVKPAFATDCPGFCTTPSNCGAGGGNIINGDCPNSRAVCCQYGTKETDTEVSEGTIHNPLLNYSLQGNPEDAPTIIERIINTVLNLLLIGGGIGFFFIILISGIKWMTAGGDKEKLQTARSQITSALIGIFIILSIFGIAKLVGSLFGINLLQFSIPKL